MLLADLMVKYMQANLDLWKEVLEVAEPWKRLPLAPLFSSSLLQLPSGSSLCSRFSRCTEWLAVNAPFAETAGLIGALLPSPERSQIVLAALACNSDAGVNE